MTRSRARAAEVLGKLVDRTGARWRAQGYRPEYLSRIAATALSEAGAEEVLDLDLLEELAVSPRESRRNGEAASPRVLPLFRGRRFGVFAHLWRDDLGSLHQPTWAGAFQVLRGRALHRTFAFEEHSRCGDDLRIGRLEARPIEWLEPGTAVAVEPGARTIHAVTHIERSALCLSIRSVRPADRLLGYARPGVAYAVFVGDPGLRLIGRCLDVFADADPESYGERLRVLLRQSDPESTFYALRQWARSGLDEPSSLRSIVRQKHGVLADTLLRAIDDLRKTAQVRELRRRTRDVDLRFLYAALYLAESRAEVYRLVEERFPGSPAAQTLGRWIARLMIESAGEIPRRLEEAFGLLVSGVTVAETLRRLGRSLEPHVELLRSASSTLRTSPVFAPLLG